MAGLVQELAMRGRLCGLGIALALALAAGCVFSGGPLPRGPADWSAAMAAAPLGRVRASIALAARADAARSQGRLGRAIDFAEQALRMDGRNPYAYYVLGRTAAASGEFATAQRYLEESQALFAASEPPNQIWLARVLRVRAGLLEESGRIEEAEQLRRQAQRLDAP